MNANRHQKIIPSLAVSSLVRRPVQTARHTSVLHSRHRKNSSLKGALIFASAALARKSLRGAFESSPVCTAAYASNCEPMRLPSLLAPHTASVRVQETSRVRLPTAITMVFPGNSSEPAKMTSARAIPKDAPITTFTDADPAAASGAPIENTRMLPHPKYAPASIASTRYERGLRVNMSALARAATATTLIVSLAIWKH